MSFARYYPTWWGSAGGGGGGSGTVTTVSVTTANGVSGSVANPTTTPAITLTLGDITPTTVTTTNGTTGTKVDIFKTTSGGGANTELLRLDGGLTTASEFTLKVLATGTGVLRALTISGGAGLWLESQSSNVTLNASGACAFRAGGATRCNVTTTAFSPQSAAGIDLGSSGLEWKSLYLATSAILSSACTLGWNADAIVVRTGAGNLALQNGVNGCRWDVHNTTGANAEFGSMWWTGNTLVIGTDKLGAGVARAISFMVGGASKWQIDTSFRFVPLGGNYDIGSSSQRCGSGYFQSGVTLGASGVSVSLIGEASNILQLGVDAGTPAAQRIKAFDGSGLNIQGSNLELGGGQSTGNVTGGSVVFLGSPAGGASNSTPNTYQTNLTITANGDIQLQKTVTAGGTTGAQTINKPIGSVNFAAAATSLVVTNSLVTANSIIVATVATNDATMQSVNVVAGSGSFTINANAAATAETRVNFLVLN